jgi:transposase-like protein
VIIAVAVNTDGRREVLGVATGASEAEPFWKSFLRSLADRGLRGVTIFVQETAEAAHQQWRQVADALRERFPKLAGLMDDSREDVLAYMAFAREHWPQIASTNPLERVNKEIKRRADVVGIFPNDAAVVRLVGALMLETNDEWAVSRRYMTLETLGAMSDTPLISLPALAA